MLGIRAFTGIEYANLTLGQSGCDIIFKTFDVPATDDAEEKEGIYTSVQNISNDGVLIQARSTLQGSDFAQNGTYAHSEVSSTNYITISAGDSIVGRFDKVSLFEPSSGTSVIKLTKGE